MQVNKNELKVYRGESFTIDKLLVNRDGTPYIVSNELQNPYWLISVSNTQYSQQKRYIRNYWLSLENFPRFSLTTPFDIHSLKISESSDDSSYDTFDDIIEANGILGGFLNGVFVEIDLSTYAVITDGNEFKYWNGMTLVKYECRIVKTFSTNDTKDWQSQNYLYSIQLVSGVDIAKEEPTFTTSYPILQPTSIKVIDYVQGDNTW